MYVSKKGLMWQSISRHNDNEDLGICPGSWYAFLNNMLSNPSAFSDIQAILQHMGQALHWLSFENW